MQEPYVASYRSYTCGKRVRRSRVTQIPSGKKHLLPRPCRSCKNQGWIYLPPKYLSINGSEIIISGERSRISDVCSLSKHTHTITQRLQNAKVVVGGSDGTLGPTRPKVTDRYRRITLYDVCNVAVAPQPTLSQRGDLTR